MIDVRPVIAAGALTVAGATGEIVARPVITSSSVDAVADTAAGHVTRVTARPLLAVTAEGAPPRTVQTPSELAVALDRVSRSVASGDVLRARAEMPPLIERWGTDPGVRAWARVLAPPTVEVRAAAGSRPRLGEFGRSEAAAYAGQWVAVVEGRVVGAAARRAELDRLLESSPHRSTAIVLRVQG